MEHTYDEGILAELYGTYEGRAPEYHFAVDRMFEHGLFRVNASVLDVGCRDPYEGMLRFMRKFGWLGPYAGVDIEFAEDVMAMCRRDHKVTLVRYDVDGNPLARHKDGSPFLLGDRSGEPYKKYHCAFLIEVMEHIEHRDDLIHELKQIAGTIFIIGPNSEFTGFYPDVPGHYPDALSAAVFDEWEFQVQGYVNFNGRDKEGGELFPANNGDPATSSEVWGVWRAPDVDALLRPRSERYRWALEKHNGKLVSVGDRPRGIKVRG